MAEITSVVDGIGSLQSKGWWKPENTVAETNVSVSIAIQHFSQLGATLKPQEMEECWSRKYLYPQTKIHNVTLTLRHHIRI